MCWKGFTSSDNSLWGIYGILVAWLKCFLIKFSTPSGLPSATLSVNSARRLFPLSPTCRRVAKHWGYTHIYQIVIWNGQVPGTCGSNSTKIQGMKHAKKRHLRHFKVCYIYTPWTFIKLLWHDETVGEKNYNNRIEKSSWLKVIIFSCQTLNSDIRNYKMIQYKSKTLSFLEDFHKWPWHSWKFKQVVKAIQKITKINW